MKITVKAVCSECVTTHKAELAYEQKEIQCPACGHTLPNFPESELNEMERAAWERERRKPAEKGPAKEAKREK